jgi:hypothetical protein
MGSSCGVGLGGVGVGHSVFGVGPGGFGFELCWRRARREKRRLLIEVEALLDGGCGEDVLGCLGELHCEWRRVGPAGPGHEQYLWECFKEVAAEVRWHVVWLEGRVGVGAPVGVFGSIAMGKGI